jgi:L-fuconolactonase
VLAKLSGLITEADWRHWRADDIRPYLDVAFECFGPDRLMIGSDWPVCTLAGDYQRTLAVVTDYLESWPDEARAAVMGGTAAAFWHLSLTDPLPADERIDS